MNTNQTPIKPLTPQEIEARRIQRQSAGIRLPIADKMRTLEQALDSVQSEEGEKPATPLERTSPVERQMFGTDQAKHEVFWKSNLFGKVTIGSSQFGMGEEDKLDPFTVVVPIDFGDQYPESITFTVKRELTPGVCLYRSQMGPAVDCTEGEMAEITFPIIWVAGEGGRKMPSTVQGKRDMDLVFLDNAGLEDGRKGALILLEVSISTRRGEFYLAFQRLYAGQIVRTTAEKAGQLKLQTVQVGNHLGAVIPLMPECAYPGSNFFQNFKHLANDIVTAGITKGASVPLSHCVVARWSPDKAELPDNLAQEGWVGANVSWFNATIGWGFIHTDDGKSVYAHFKQIEDAAGKPLWKSRAYPMLTPMARLAIKTIAQPDGKRKATAICPF